MRNQAVTIKHIAHHCDVSIATVSRVINDASNVNPDIRKKVLDAIKELNYTPNRLASSLKSNSTHIIGLIVIDIANPAQMNIAREIENIVSQHGYILLIMSSDDDAEKERKNLTLLSEHMVDAIILTATGQNDDLILSIKQSGTPIVVIDRRPASSEISFIGVDKQTACYMAVKKLFELGYTRIALANGPKDIITNFDRYCGYTRAFYDNNTPLTNEYIFYGPFNEKYGREVFQAIMRLQPLPEVIISGGEMITIGILEMAHNLGIKIPKDISLLSFGNITNPELVTPKLSYIDTFPNTIGIEVSNVILSKIAKKSINPIRVILKAEIVLGDSTLYLHKK